VQVVLAYGAESDRALGIPGEVCPIKVDTNIYKKLLLMPPFFNYYGCIELQFQLFISSLFCTLFFVVVFVRDTLC
jgi:hypothetical protein